MELTPDQIRAAEAAGRSIRPATEEQVGRLTMQRRIFTIGGRPHVVARGDGGFLETYATLAPVLQNPDPMAAAPAETVQEAADADATASLEVAAENRAGRGAQVMRRGRAPRVRRGV